MTDELTFEDINLIDGLAVVIDPLATSPELLDIPPDTTPMLVFPETPAPEGTEADALLSLPS